jgi:DNA-binding NarL/FixJ family response regulator
MADSVAQESLTPRETDVLMLLAQGLDNKSISARLQIALGTVKSHVKAVLEKLAASSRTQAVATAHQRGLVDQSFQGPRHARAASAD